MSKEQFSDVPAYRQPQADQMQKQTQTSMNIMLIVMTAMMVMCLFYEASRIRFILACWCNIYSTGQSNTHLTSKND